MCLCRDRRDRTMIPLREKAGDAPENHNGGPLMESRERINGTDFNVSALGMSLDERGFTWSQRRNAHASPPLVAPARATMVSPTSTLGMRTEKIFQNFLDLLSGWRHFSRFTI